MLVVLKLVIVLKSIFLFKIKIGTKPTNENNSQFEPIKVVHEAMEHNYLCLGKSKQTISNIFLCNFNLRPVEHSSVRFSHKKVGRKHRLQNCVAIWDQRVITCLH